MAAPLEGLKVIELARILAGPWAGQTHDRNGIEPEVCHMGRGKSLDPLESLLRAAAPVVLSLSALPCPVCGLWGAWGWTVSRAPLFGSKVSRWSGLGS